MLSVDGERIITAGSDRTARAWRVSLRGLVSSMLARTSACLPIAARVDALREAPEVAARAFAACEAQHGR